MQRKIKSWLLIGVLLSSFVISTFVGSHPRQVQAAEPFFTLTVISRLGYDTDYLLPLGQHLAEIGIAVDIHVLNWSDYVQLLVGTKDFDICHMAFVGGDDPTDYSLFYSENGSLNLLGYETSLDWNESLGTGENEWYLREGNLTMPPDSEERVQHYWAWEQYLMDELLPCLPTFTSKSYEAFWATLKGYAISDGVIQSWGKMFWSGAHANQTATEELVIYLPMCWSDLNPLTQKGSFAGGFYSFAMMDPLIWYDADRSAWPHLATSWEHLNATHVRFRLREGVKWQPDPEGLFPEEYFDAEDVFFTLYCWKYLFKDLNSYQQHAFDWLENMTIVDQYTIDFYIDGNPATPENDPYASYSLALNEALILPEHYLNQTQLEDGTTPDVRHSSWGNFSRHAFGTGILAFDSYIGYNETAINEALANGTTLYNETRLTTFPACWRMEPSLLSDPTLDWRRRFGDRWDLEMLRVKIIEIPRAIQEFAWGYLDLVDVSGFPENRSSFIANPAFEVQSELRGFEFRCYGFNLREHRFPIGSRTPCPDDPSMSIGLAVRKAIAYAIDRVEINNLVHAGEWAINDYPISQKLGIWCNPNIIRYSHNLEKAKEYMTKAGFDMNTLSSAPTSIPIVGFECWLVFVALTIVVTITIITSRKRSFEEY